MPKVEFYEVRGARWEPELCRQVEAAYRSGERLYLLAGSEADARRWDELLWTYSQESFVPHALWQGEDDCEEPVAVGWQPGNPNRATCVVLAGPATAQDLAIFERVLDFAPVDVPALLPAARARYRALRAAGFAVDYHRAGS